MVTKRTTLEVLESIERNTADTLRISTEALRTGVDALRVSRDNCDICTELLQRAKTEEDTSGRIAIGGMRVSVTKEFFDKYGKWILGAIAVTGWGAKLLSLFHKTP